MDREPMRPRGFMRHWRRLVERLTMSRPTRDVTSLLIAQREGDKDAVDRLLQAVYADSRQKRRPSCVTSGRGTRCSRRLSSTNRKARKRGGSQTRVTLDGALASSGPRSLDLIALDEALNELARLDPQQSRRRRAARLRRPERGRDGGGDGDLAGDGEALLVVLAGLAGPPHARPRPGDDRGLRVTPTVAGRTNETPCP
jgi:hypothetical protein